MLVRLYYVLMRLYYMLAEVSGRPLTIFYDFQSSTLNNHLITLKNIYYEKCYMINVHVDVTGEKIFVQTTC